MSREVFAENIVVADPQSSWSAVVFQILRRIADNTARVKLISRANSRDAGNVNVWTDDAVRTNFHQFINDSEWADANCGIKFGF